MQKKIEKKNHKKDIMQLCSADAKMFSNKS